MESEQLAHYIAKLTLEKKAENVTILDLREITTITDYFVICSGNSDIQVKTICDYITDKLEQEHIKIWYTEGYRSFNWVLLDLVDVVVHIFLPQVREYYALERLWGDAKFMDVKNES